MEKQTTGLMALLLMASGIFYSCSNIANKDSYALEFDSIQVNKTVHLFGDTAKPACNLIVNFTYVSQAKDITLQDSLNTFFLAACFGGQYLAMMPENAVSQYAEKYAGDYRTDLEPLYKQDEKEGEENTQAWYNYYKEIDGGVQFRKNNLLVYRVYYQEYTGGAHGSYMTSFLNMDLKLLRLLHLEDLFVDDYKEALTELLWMQLADDNKVATRQEVEDLGYGSTGDLEPTENFYLTSQGITFYYNIYEIAPYVMGATSITLPYENIEHLLSDHSGILQNIR